MKSWGSAGCGGPAGAFWFAGWLFTIAVAKLGFWKAVLGLILWPYFLGAILQLPIRG